MNEQTKSDTFQLVLNVLATLAAVVVNPALGLTVAGARIAKIIQLITTLANQGSEANAALIDLNDQLKGLDRAGGPIPQEVWDDWDARHEAAKARIAAA